MKRLYGFIVFFLIIALSANSSALGMASFAAEDTDAQINLIYENREQWDFSEEYLPSCFLYAVTDMDGNGRFEVIGAVNYSSGNFTHIEVYEVNEQHTGLCRLGDGVYEDFSLIFAGSDLAHDICSPDVLGFQPVSRITEVPVLTDKDGERTFVFDNFNGGLEENELIKEAVSLRNGKLECKPIVYRVSHALSQPVFYDSNMNSISEAEFENWKSNFSGFQKRTATIGWQIDITPNDLRESCNEWNLF